MKIYNIRHERAGRKILPLFFIITISVLMIFSPSCSLNQKEDSQTWTVLLYMDGDNDLSQAALDDIAEMEAIGSTNNINVIVQLDLNNSVTTKRYRILKGTRELISDVGELDMANPETLTDFLAWAGEEYPADRTILILWNHGNGWDQGDGPSSPNVLRRKAYSIFTDADNQSTYLSNYLVKNAIKDPGIKIDILGLDASIMGTIEALYEFRELSDIIISSQEVGESHGWDYTAILSRLVNKPEMDSEELSNIIVNSYKDFFEEQFYPANPKKEKSYTISAIRTKYLSPIANEVNVLAQKLITLIDSDETRDAALTSINNARDSVQEIDHYVQPYVYVDLADLAGLLSLDNNLPQLLSNAVIAEYHGSARGNAHGISIVFFKLPEADGLTYDSNYKNYNPQTKTGNMGEFINQFSWDEFLYNYYQNENSKQLAVLNK